MEGCVFFLAIATIFPLTLSYLSCQAQISIMLSLDVTQGFVGSCNSNVLNLVNGLPDTSQLTPCAQMRQFYLRGPRSQICLKRLNSGQEELVHTTSSLSQTSS